MMLRVPYTLSSSVRPADDPDAETKTISATGPDYETAARDLASLVPEGWRQLHVMVASG